MGHMSAAGSNYSTRENSDVINPILDQAQEQDMPPVGQRPMQSKMSYFQGVLPPVIESRKRCRASSSCDEDKAAKRARTGSPTSRYLDTHKWPGMKLDALPDNMLIEIFNHLPQFPDLLKIRQVCFRWNRLSCDPHLWSTLSFAGQRNVTTENVTALFRNSTSFQNLRQLSLAKTDFVTEDGVILIAKSKCAATLESVDLSRCSGAGDKSVIEFSHCPRLKELRVSRCLLVSSRSIIPLATRCPQLEVLDLNRISGVRDSLLETISLNCPYLRVLNISKAHDVTDNGISQISKGCPLLEDFDFSSCRNVSDLSILDIARNMRFLRNVGLAESRVTDVGVAELTRVCNKLKELNLARCTHISNHGVESIISNCCERLKLLNLALCQNVTDVYVERIIQDCPSLECLDVTSIPCRMIFYLVARETASRDLKVYF